MLIKFIVVISESFTVFITVIEHCENEELSNEPNSVYTGRDSETSVSA